MALSRDKWTALVVVGGGGGGVEGLSGSIKCGEILD